MIFLKSKFSKLYFISLGIILYITHFYLIKNNTLINYDDPTLILPIKSLASFNQYFKFCKIGHIPDVQPVRDFFYFLAIKTSSVLPFLNFHGLSVTLWFFCTYLFFKILNLFFKNVTIAYVIVFIMAISPVASSSIAWVSALKHILSTTFILCLTLYSIKLTENDFNFLNSLKLLLFFNLAIYSHPINLLWPFWFILFQLNNKSNWKKLLFFLSPVILSMFFCLVLNQHYYNTIYVEYNSGIDKFDPLLANDFGARFLSLGRYAYLSIFPFDSLPSPHYIGSYQNILGLIVFVLFCYGAFYFYKKNKSYLPFLFLIYFLIPLIPVTYKITRIFCSDTYLLNANLGIYLFIAYILNELKNGYFLKLLCLYALILVVFNYYYVQIYRDSFELWKYSYNKEATPDSTVALAKMYMYNKDFNSAEQLIRRVHDWQPDNIDIYSLAVNNVFFNPNISDDYKIKRILNFNPQRPITHFYLSILYSNNNNVQEFNSHILKVFTNPSLFLMDLFDQKEKVMGTFLGMCEKHKVEQGPMQLEVFKKNFINNDWNYSLINKYKKNGLLPKVVFEL